MVFVTHGAGGLREIGAKGWLFLALSGLATGASWLCYYRALQVGPTAPVITIDKCSPVLTVLFAALLLRESVNGKILSGVLLVTAGALIVAFA